ncbi:MAG: HEAT repeat domain-containing protein [Planctomycetaceae bacterium]|nr:HEAT repeat domain-containing protein [Planctomycetaceae bacterium]
MVPARTLLIPILLLLGIRCVPQESDSLELNWSRARLAQLSVLDSDWIEFLYGTGDTEGADEEAIHKRIDATLALIESSPDPRIRQLQAMAIHDVLRWHGNETYLPRLLKALDGEPEEEVRRALFNTYMLLSDSYGKSDEELKVLTSRMRDSSDRIRMLAAFSLMGATDSDDNKLNSEHPLVRELSSERDPDIRALAAQVFGLKSGRDDRRVVAAILRALRQEEENPTPLVGTVDAGANLMGYDLRSSLFAYAGSLGRGAAGLVPLMLDCVRFGGPGTGFDEGRWHPQTLYLIDALRGIGDAADPLLIDALSSPSARVRQLAAIALSERKAAPQAAVPVLLKSLRGDCDGYCAYIFVRFDEVAIGRYGAVAVPGLIKMAAQNSENRLPILAILRMDQDDVEVTEAILRSASDSDAAVRLTAVNALESRIKHTDMVLRALPQAENDPAAAVAEAALAVRDRIELKMTKRVQSEK